ncbi:hypothetical protein D3C87_1477810 [compost metagenome]
MWFDEIPETALQGYFLVACFKLFGRQQEYHGAGPAGFKFIMAFTVLLPINRVHDVDKLFVDLVNDHKMLKDAVDQQVGNGGFGYFGQTLERAFYTFSLKAQFLGCFNNSKYGSPFFVCSGQLPDAGNRQVKFMMGSNGGQACGPAICNVALFYFCAHGALLYFCGEVRVYPIVYLIVEQLVQAAFGNGKAGGKAHSLF